MAGEPTRTNIGALGHVEPQMRPNELGRHEQRYNFICIEWTNTDDDTTATAWFYLNADYEYDRPFDDIAGPNAGNQILLDHARAQWAVGNLTVSDLYLPGPERTGKQAGFVRNLRAGFVNPFDPNGVTKWNRRQDIDIRMGERGTINDTGITLADKLQTQSRSEAGGKLSLLGWTATRNGNDSFQLDYNFLENNPGVDVRDTALPVPAGTTHIAAVDGIIAMVTWLNRILTDVGSPPDVPADLSDISGRQFNDESAATSVFSNGVVHKSYVGGAGSRIADMSLVWPFASFSLVGGGTGHTPNFGFIEQALTRTLSAPADVTVAVKQKAGSTDSPVEADSFEFTNAEQALLVRSGQPVVRVGAQYAPLAGTRVIDHDTLPVVEGETYRWMPRPADEPLVRAVHSYSTSDASLRLRDPRVMCSFTGAQRALDILNDGSGSYEVQDHTGRSLFVLGTNERAELEFLWDRAGAGRMVGSIPHRLVTNSGSDLGNLATGYWSFDATHWARLPRMPAASHVHADAFEVGSGHLSDAATNISTAFTAEMVRLKKAGRLIWYHVIDVGITQNGTMGEHRAALFLRRGTTAIEVVDDIHAVSIVGPDGQRTYRLLMIELAVQPNDVLYSGIITPKSTTMNFAENRLRSTVRILRLTQEV